MGNYYNEASDIYSFGVVIYEIFSCTLPFTNISDILVNKVVDINVNDIDQIKEYENFGYEVSIGMN